MLFDRKSRLIRGALLLAVFSVAACEKRGGEGPAERAGKQVDKAVEQAGQAMDKAKESIAEATKDAVKKTEEAATAATESARELVKGPSSK
jgi:hypothetical protein